MDIDTSRWSGEGTFTAMVIEQLKRLEAIAFLRVEDSPSGHIEANYSFISNEIYVQFHMKPVRQPGRWLGIVPIARSVPTPVMTLEDLEAQLATMEEVGAPDYADEAMLQYLKAERITPPYQTRGYKMVELLRIYRLTS